MSTKIIDERVVEMRFDNKDFESNAKKSMSTVEKLKQSLNFKGISKGLGNLGAAIGKVSFSTMASGVETISSKFSALEVMGVTALANITNSAVNAGKQIASALTIDPIKMGFQEYETQINAVQTILANTQSKGSTLADVNSALDELNTYADKTIYNFTEMTRNIGTFTAAGVDLERSVTSIKGIANLAAVSGSSAFQASTAMYQLSQAIAAGKVQLMDWNSVVNAGMGGELFQNALKRTAEHFGTNVDEMISKYGSFRESLTQGGWLTTEVLTETLTQLSGAYSEADLIAQGYSESQAKEIAELAQTAVDAATKVKTFSQLWDTMKEAAQSGWTQTWEILVGDFEEAKELLTSISDVAGEAINKSAEARNNMLQGWKDLGGRTSLINSFKNAFEGINRVIKPVSEAFREIFPQTTSEQLYDLTVKLEKFTEKLKISDETAEKLKDTFKGVFSILDIGKQGLSAALKPFGEFLTGKDTASFADSLLDGAASIGRYFTELNKGIKEGDGFSIVSETITKGLDKISEIASEVSDKFGGFTEILSSLGEIAGNVFGKVTEAVGKGMDWIGENISAGDIFAGLAGGGIFALTKKLSGFIGKNQDAFGGIFSDKKSNAASKLSKVLETVHGSLESFQEGIKVASIVGIAGAIAILTSSLKTLSDIEPESVAYSLAAIGGMVAILSAGFKSMSKALSRFDSKGTLKAGVSMMAMAEAVNILASAMERMSELSLGEIAKGLVGISGTILGLSLAVKSISKGGVTLRTSVAILALAKACEMLGESFSEFSSLSWDEIGRGLTAMGGALGEFTIALSVLSNTGGWGSLLGGTGILIAAQSLDEISENLEHLGGLSWEEIGHGLTAMGGALGEFTIALGALSKLGGFGGILGGTAILISVQSLDEISENLERLSALSWDEIGRGLTAMGGALGEFTIALGILSKVGGFGAVLGGTALLISVQALDGISETLETLGGLSWDEIGRGLSAMGGALGEFAIALGGLSAVGGFGAVLGGGAILIAVQSLNDISQNLSQIGDMSWEEIARGLSGMGGALAEVAIISGTLGTLAPLGGLLGGGAILLGVQGLAQLSEAFGTFGEMSWDEISRGLVGMGGALTEVSVISGLLGTLAPLGGLLGGGSLLLSIQGLGELADSLKKFGELSWDEIGRGLSAMGGALGETALGGFLNTLSGIGALSISAIAQPLGELADSLKKWVGVTVPEGLGYQLGLLADGVGKFTLGGLGSASISTVAAPLGTMADSVKKWSDVTIPETLETGMKGLAKGVQSFSFAFVGGWSIGAINEPLAGLASAVKKWNGVTLPENLETNLGGLAKGVQAFSFAFVGGWSIGAINEPLAELAGAVKKWNGITLPENIQNGLKGLAKGVEAFSFAFVAGWSIDAVNEPLKGLADAVKKWNGVSVPEGLESGLKGLANGLDAISDVDLMTLANGSVESAVNNVKKLAAIFDENTLNASSAKEFAEALEILGNTNIDNFTKSFSNSAKSMKTIGSDIMESLLAGITSKKNALNSTAKELVNAMEKTISGKKSNFKKLGATLMDQLANGIKSKTSSAKSAVSSVLNAAASGARSYYSTFYSAGAYAATGFANGISANSYKAAAQARAMARAAARAAEAALNIHSPSKVFYKIGDFAGQGFVNALNDFANKAYDSGVAVSSHAEKGLRNAIGKISKLIDGGMDMQPVIRPVMDLSLVESDIRAVNGMLINGTKIRTTVNTEGVSALMKRKNQNGSNEEIVSALRELRKDLNSVQRNSYTINGITYDDGSNISDAVRALVRAAMIERRV